MLEITGGLDMATMNISLSGSMKDWVEGQTNRGVMTTSASICAT